MELELIPRTHVDQVWPVVAPMLEPALATECSIDQLRMLVVRGESHLIVMLEDGAVVGATTVEFTNYPNKRIAVGGAFGGRGVCTQEVFDQIKQWCKSMGASEFRTYCKDAQARLYARVGMEKIYNVVGVQL